MPEFITVRDYIIECLYLSGVRHVFGYPGGPIMPIVDAVYEHPKMKWVLTRHECGAAFCASATAKLHGDLAVCVATSGPGASNLVTGLLDAQLDRAPVLAITGLVPTSINDLPYFQNIDQTRLLERVCGLSMECMHPDQIPNIMKTLIGYIRKRRGVAHLAIHLDVQAKKIAYVPTDFSSLPDNRPINLIAPQKTSFAAVAEMLNRNDDVVIVAGKRSTFAGDGIRKLSLKICAPVIASFSAKGVINEEFENYFGAFGLYGAPANPRAYAALKHAKVVIAFGADDLISFVTGLDGRQNRILIQCEPDVTSVDYRFIQHENFLGPLNDVAEQLTKACRAKKSSPYLDRIHKICKHLDAHDVHRIEREKNEIQKGVHYVALLKKLNKYLDRDKVTVAFDVGDVSVWSLQYLKFTKRQKVLISHLLGSMGFCMPALIAAKLSQPDQLVVGIAGDGGFQMLMGELNTAIQQKLNVVLIIFNNGILQRVATGNKKLYGAVLYSPNFAEVAKASGAKGYTIETEEDIDRVFKKAFAEKEKPVVINVVCDSKLGAPISEWHDTFSRLLDS